MEWPRVRDLPAEEQEPFEKWLMDYGQTRPVLEGVDWNNQDGYYSVDLDRWRAQGRRADARPYD